MEVEKKEVRAHVAKIIEARQAQGKEAAWVPNGDGWHRRPLNKVQILYAARFMTFPLECPTILDEAMCRSVYDAVRKNENPAKLRAQVAEFEKIISAQRKLPLWLYEAGPMLERMATRPDRDEINLLKDVFHRLGMTTKWILFTPPRKPPAEADTKVEAAAAAAVQEVQGDLRSGHKGFTLIECIIVMSLMLILGLGSLQLMHGWTISTWKNECRNEARAAMSVGNIWRVQNPTVTEPYPAETIGPDSIGGNFLYRTGPNVTVEYGPTGLVTARHRALQGFVRLSYVSGGAYSDTLMR